MSCSPVSLSNTHTHRPLKVRPAPPHAASHAAVALSGAILEANTLYCARGPEGCGTTLISAALVGGGSEAGRRTLVVANVGDSRAVLCAGDGQPVALSDDHKPDRADERKRVEALGGVVHKNIPGFAGALPDWMAPGELPYRVYHANGEGGLAMSRAIGDAGLAPLVVADPEVTTRVLREDDKFVVLASDGVWDVLTNKEVCKIGEYYMNPPPPPDHDSGGRAQALPASGRNPAASLWAKEAAACIVRVSIKRGSSDNVTAMVVAL